MLILWITKSKKKEQDANVTDDTAFKKHDAEMKKFHASHPDLSVINTRDIVLANGDVLAEVSGFKLSKHAGN